MDAKREAIRMLTCGDRRTTGEPTIEPRQNNENDAITFA